MAVSKVEIERRMRRFTKMCHTHSLKFTHQRMDVSRQLRDAETIYQNVSHPVPSISRDTVYRLLSTLEEHGLIRRAEMLSGKARYYAIDKGDYPSWKVCVQIMPPEETKTCRWNIFDITKVWPPCPKKRESRQHVPERVVL